VKIGIVGTVFAGMLGVAGFGAYNIYTSLDGGSGGGGSGTTDTAAQVNTAPPTAQEIARTGDAFLAAWSSGDVPKAAGLTDSVQTATAGMTGYRLDGHIGTVTATPGTPTATGMHFSVTAVVTYQGLRRTWSYASALTVARNAKGDPAVKWAPSVLEPDLTTGDTLVTGLAETPDVEFLDRNGTVMTAAGYPSLRGIFDKMSDTYGDKLTGGTPAVETYVKKADGTQGRTLFLMKKGVGRKLHTTLDASVQAAAEKAVAGKHQAGVTAIDTDTGEIRAIANSPAGGFDYAMNARVAPGSTFKIVTAAALLENGMTRSSSAPCVNGANYLNGRSYHNDSGVPDKPGADLDWDFAVSCNTGFITQAKHLGSTGLRDTAAQFGLTQTWNVGTPCTDPNVPGGTDDELTSEMIGQGHLQMSPLIMASVAATARDGSFHQPRIVAKSLLDGPVAKADGISSGVSSQLRKMMHGVISYGTGVGVMTGSDAGAKTGSAEVEGQAATNGWFTAFSGHLAAAAVVQDAGHGNSSAGPIVAAVLRAG
jgi:hypothetical protein